VKNSGSFKVAFWFAAAALVVTFFFLARSEYQRGRADQSVADLQIESFDRGLAVSGLWSVVTAVRDSYDGVETRKGDVDWLLGMLKKYDLQNPEVDGDKYALYRVRVAAFKKAFPGRPVPEPLELMSNADLGGIPAGAPTAAPSEVAP